MEENLETLKQLAEKHSVHYKLYPNYSLAEGTAAKVGFEIDLCGSHDHGQTRNTPGCELCVHTFEDLRRLAEWVLPREERPSLYEIDPFDSSLHADPRNRLRPEVVLQLKIRHRHNPDGPIDECEERCLAEIEQNLKRVGIRRSPKP